MSIPEVHTEPLVLDDAFIQRPHRHYVSMRADHPVRRVRTASGLPAWLVTRYADVRAVLRDPRVAKDSVRTAELFAAKRPPGQATGEFTSSLVKHMLNSDPPDHTRLRKLVMKAFTPKRVEALRPRVEEITAALLDEMAGQSEVDLIDAYAFPLPISVISELLGVDESRRDEFRAWSNALVGADRDAVSAAAGEMTAYLKELIEAKRRAPADDMLSDLVHASEDLDRLSQAELLAMAFLLLVAGHETTVNLIGNCVLGLLCHPAQLAAVRADPGLVPNAVEEALRWEGPVNLATVRHTTEPVTVSDVEIPAGEIVFVALGSADRDERRFDEPDTFDITRDVSGHVAFGHGIHFCLGAPLARMEGRIAVRRLLERYDDLRLARPVEDLRWRFSTLVRGVEELPVSL